MGFLEMSKIDLGCFDFHDQWDHPERFLKYRGDKQRHVV